MAAVKKDANRDPITGTPGAHPIETGVGTALGGLAAGAAAGAVAGPIGAAVGAIVGGVAGGAAGTMVGEEFDPTAEETYWREQYPSRPYYSDEVDFDDMSPAYRYGWESRARLANQSFEESEETLKAGWEETKHDARLGWQQARGAVRDSWDHSTPQQRRLPR